MSNDYIVQSGDVTRLIGNVTKLLFQLRGKRLYLSKVGKILASRSSLLPPSKGVCARVSLSRNVARQPFSRLLPSSITSLFESNRGEIRKKRENRDTFHSWETGAKSISDVETTRADLSLFITNDGLDQ